ncbi:hypothetical protein [Microcoleus sp. D2_18a_B4]|uniref:hypothetical protein n=1 Tax=Microcoleus sp. D2_18a_B4 TaxID=3055329 RepID=UPI002FD5AB0B
MTDQIENYQRKMDAEYFAANFKKEHWPADPFETGIMTDASYLDIADLAAIFKAGKALQEEGNEAFYHGLINFKRSQDENWEAVVKVNPLYLDARRQRMLEISELLSDFYFGNCEDFAQKWNEILDMNDPQLAEMLRQVEEVLGLTPREMKIMEVIDEN